MKSRFSTIDIKATLAELQRFIGMRVANVYDVDNKTYLVKLARPDHKAVLLLESGVRIHSTEFEWPKNMNPSGFAMKMRKHLRTRRLEKIEQLGIDRIIDMQFGSGEAAYHVILELYDRGNIVLTDFEYTILNILRPRTDDSQDVKFAVRETYPVENARQHQGVPTQDEVKKMFASAKEGDNLKKIFNPQLVYGPAVLEHCLLKSGLPDNARLGKEFKLDDETDFERLYNAILEAEQMLQTAGTSKGYIIQKSEKKANVTDGGEPEVLLTYQEFHPYLFKQHEKSQHVEFESFDKAVDEFFSKMESQKIDVKVLQQEKSALKKLDNVKQDHEKRLKTLHKAQETDENKGKLIEMNLPLVDKAITIVQSALANQIDWSEISQIVKEAQAQSDAVASAIKGLKLDTNHIVMLLSDPYADSDDEDDEDIIRPLKVDIDLGLTAYSNARKYFDKKRVALKKEQKTLDASGKALKSAEKKTKQTLKEVATTASINKVRKTYWFEKFLWFISSENHLVIGGRDQQQNELIVKRYLRAGDLYVHADLHGASSVLIKNPTGEPVPPKTLNEAGTMAVCNSAAWDAKVVTSAWWVHHDQVSKTAPSGEYLTTGSFMVRGKKNYLPPCYLVYGFGFLFKLDESSVFKHKGERRVKSLEEDAMSMADSVASELSMETTEDVDSSSDSDEEVEDETKHEHDEMDTIPEGLEMDMSTDSTPVCDNIKEITETELQLQSEKGLVDSLHSEHSRKSELSTTNHEAGATAAGAGDFSNASQNNTNVEEGDEKPNSKSDSSDDESLFPDTSIKLQHVKGGKFELQRNVSSSSSGKASEDVTSEQSVDQTTVSNKRLSAKQRRLLKKQKGKQPEESALDQVAETEKPSECEVKEEEHKPDGEASTSQTKSSDEKVPTPQPPAAKRGQKAKAKKIKDRYADQDEEERELKMKILASSGAPKENPKKTKKAKQQQQKIQQQQKQKDQKQQRANWRLTAEDIKQETPTISVTASDVKVEEKDVSDEENEQENLQTAEDADILDSLTGIPDVEDLLLFSVPVCAPYSVLINYKYKVKLTPGTTKRGKAAKLALHTFLNDKATTQREKDLLKSVKDVDLSRYMPGKVKVSAPNLQKAKSKR